MKTLVVLILFTATVVVVLRWLATSSPWTDQVHHAKMKLLDTVRAQRSGPVSPKVLERRIAARLSEGMLRQSFFGKAPSTVTIILHPEDHERIRPFLPEVEALLQKKIAHIMQRHELRADGQPRIVFAAREDRAEGSPDARFSYDQPTMIESTPAEPDATVVAHTTMGAVLRESWAGGVDHFLPASGSVKIGRTTECDIVIDNDRVSRVHAEIQLTDQGWVVRDLGSKNGTFVNGTRVLRPTPVRAGETIGLGKHVEFKLDIGSEHLPAPVPDPGDCS